MCRRRTHRQTLGTRRSLFHGGMVKKKGKSERLSLNSDKVERKVKEHTRSARRRSTTRRACGRQDEAVAEGPGHPELVALQAAAAPGDRGRAQQARAEAARREGARALEQARRARAARPSSRRSRPTPRSAARPSRAARARRPPPPAPRPARRRRRRPRAAAARASARGARTRGAAARRRRVRRRAQVLDARDPEGSRARAGGGVRARGKRSCRAQQGGPRAEGVAPRVAEPAAREHAAVVQGVPQKGAVGARGAGGGGRRARRRGGRRRGRLGRAAAAARSARARVRAAQELLRIDDAGAGGGGGRRRRRRGVKGSLVVGVVGYPNAGKSSLINSPRRSRVAASRRRRATTAMQTIQLDAHVRLIDRPASLDAGDAAARPPRPRPLLRSCVDVGALGDPVGGRRDARRDGRRARS